MLLINAENREPMEQALRLGGTTVRLGFQHCKSFSFFFEEIKKANFNKYASVHKSARNSIGMYYIHIV